MANSVNGLFKTKQKKTKTSIVCTLYQYCILIVYNINLSRDLFCPFFLSYLLIWFFIPKVFVMCFSHICERPPIVYESGSSRSAECTGCVQEQKFHFLFVKTCCFCDIHICNIHMTFYVGFALFIWIDEEASKTYIPLYIH